MERCVPEVLTLTSLTNLIFVTPSLTLLYSPLKLSLPAGMSYSAATSLKPILSLYLETPRADASSSVLQWPSASYTLWRLPHEPPGNNTLSRSPLREPGLVGGDTLHCHTPGQCILVDAEDNGKRLMTRRGSVSACSWEHLLMPIGLSDVSDTECYSTHTPRPYPTI